MNLEVLTKNTSKVELIVLIKIEFRSSYKKQITCLEIKIECVGIPQLHLYHVSY